MIEQLLERHYLRLVVDDRQQDDAESGLHLSHLVQRVQDDLRHRITLHLDHDADALAVRLVAQIGNPFNLFLADQLGDAFNQPCFVDLVRNLRDDDRLPLALRVRLDLGPRPELDDAAPGRVGRADAIQAVDETGGREVRARDRGHQIPDRDLRIFDQHHQSVDHLAQVVRRDVRRHADRDAGGAVDQEVGNASRQHQRLGLRAVIVRTPVHRLLVDVVADHLLGELGQTHLGIPHGRRVVAVERAEVALAVHERIAHGEVLGHAHHRVIDRRVAMGVIFTHDVADDASRFLVRPVRAVAALPHAIQHAPVHGLHAVAHVRQRTADDHAHCVIEIAALHLIFDADGNRLLEGENVVVVVVAHLARTSGGPQGVVSPGHQGLKKLLWTHSGDLHVKSIGADIDLVRPRDVTQRSDMNPFELTRIVPEGKDALSNQIRKIYLADYSVWVTEPKPVIR